ncbi:uncharacterized protein LOC133737512 isoform X2 [Rosa rugosa]|uniref:uncharacterized protein LOC133737512 isoform X2 n=1 Tax=Rosa rugosa TaxID=74645 RepID=UPI002B410A3D|nr:uncharacterized protein LOC133737512 isoform X2 [Rosa rugosa]
MSLGKAAKIDNEERILTSHKDRRFKLEKAAKERVLSKNFPDVSLSDKEKNSLVEKLGNAFWALVEDDSLEDEVEDLLACEEKALLDELAKANLEEEEKEEEKASGTNSVGDKKPSFTGIDYESVNPDDSDSDREFLKDLDCAPIELGDEMDWGVCEVCLKENEHHFSHCPYLFFGVPDGATLGPGYALACKECYEVDGHPDRPWEALAVRKVCDFCMWRAHWTEDCPYQVPEGDRAY